MEEIVNNNFQTSPVSAQPKRKIWSVVLVVVAIVIAVLIINWLVPGREPSYRLSEEEKLEALSKLGDQTNVKILSDAERARALNQLSPKGSGSTYVMTEAEKLEALKALR